MELMKILVEVEYVWIDDLSFNICADNLKDRLSTAHLATFHQESI